MDELQRLLDAQGASGGAGENPEGKHRHGLKRNLTRYGAALKKALVNNKRFLAKVRELDEGKMQPLIRRIRNVTGNS